MTQRKKIASIVGICSVLSILGGCTKSTITPTTQETTNTPAIQQPTTQKTTRVSQTTPKQQQLTINNKCIGCGRCTITAPENFAMGGNHAKVISQQNISSSVVHKAIAHCPVQAIQIIEV